MIQPLRTFHRRFFLVLAIIVSAVFVAGLIVRPNPRPTRGVQATLVAFTATDVKDHLFVVQISTTPDGQSSLRLVPIKPFLAPDLLVYYTSEALQQNALPSNARLLGRWDAGSTYPLPESLNGFVVLYSAAQKTALDSVSIEGKK